MLWEDLGKAELEHAETIETLRRQVSEKTVFVDEGKTKTLAVQSLVNYTKGSIEEARMGKMTRINALAVAKDLENSLLEKKYFTFFKSSSGQFNDLMQELFADTTEHFKMLESRLEMVRKSSL